MKNKLKIGTVKKKSSDKTISVVYDYYLLFKKYNKKISFTTKILVHDTNNECFVGDKIYFRFTKPISKKKNSIFVKKCT